MKAKERMFLNRAGDALCAEGAASAAYLYAGVGDTIPADAVKMFGVVDGWLTKGAAKAEQAKLAAEKKAAAKGADKAVKPSANKASAGLTINRLKTG